MSSDAPTPCTTPVASIARRITLDGQYNVLHAIICKPQWIERFPVHADMFTDERLYRLAAPAIETLNEQGSVDPISVIRRAAENGSATHSELADLMTEVCELLPTKQAVQTDAAALIERSRLNHAERCIKALHDDLQRGAISCSECVRSLDALSDSLTLIHTAVGAVVLPLDKITPKAIQWLWPGRIALGKLTLIAGDAGLGKSLSMLDIAARVSAGRSLPDGRNPTAPGGVVILNAEDDVADTTVPRLLAAEADLRQIKAIAAVTDPSGLVRNVDLATDVRYVRKAIEQVNDCRLVVIDPISSYCGKTDSHNNTEVRGLLTPLAMLAAELNVAIVMVTHLNKGSGKAIHRAMGSVAFTAQSRMSWQVCRDPQEYDRRLMLPVKANLACDSGTGLAYRVETRDLPEHNLHGIPYVVWDTQPVRMTADEALGHGHADEDDGADDEVRMFLREVLADGPLPSTEVLRLGKQEGFSPGRMRSAFAGMGCKPHKVGFGGSWMWALSAPEDFDHQPKDHEDHPLPGEA